MRDLTVRLCTVLINVMLCAFAFWLFAFAIGFWWSSSWQLMRLGARYGAALFPI